MAFKELECVACDLDGSLLDKRNLISEADVRTIEYLRNSGVKVVISTGRHHAAAACYARELKLDLPVISCDGCHIEDCSGDVKFSAAMPEKVVDTAVKYIFDNKLWFNIYTDRRLLYNTKIFENMFWHVALERAKDDERARMEYCRAIPKLAEGEKVEKITVYFFTAKTRKAFSEIANSDERLEARAPDEMTLEILNSGVSKRSGLEFLSGRCGFRLDKTLVLGDNGNDVEAMKCAGWAVAPASASKCAIESASFVTSKNGDSPLTAAIEQLFSAES